MNDNNDNAGLISRCVRIKRSQHGGIFKSKTACMGIIAGATGSGKSVLLFECLTTPNLLDYNRLYISTPTTDQIAYQFLLHGFNYNLKKVVINDLYHDYEEDDSIEDSVETFCKNVAKYNPQAIESNRDKQVKVTLSPNFFEAPGRLDKGKKNLVIFDDCVNDKNQTMQKQYYIAGRHNNCSVFYLTQKYFDVPKIIRDNTNIFILFKQPERSLTMLLNDLDKNNAQQFKLLANDVWNNSDYGYVAINTDRKIGEKKITNNVILFEMPNEEDKEDTLRFN